MTDFTKETMYFIVTDRFYDGETNNNLGKENEMFDETKTDWNKHWGGDLRGIIKKLDYLKGMGITAIWITPVFEQIDHVIGGEGKKYAPYHGYWAKDFKRIDRHLVDKDEDIRVFQSDDTEFDELIKEMHKRDMKLVLDIVCNHSNPHVEGGRGELFDDGKLLASYHTDTNNWYHKYGGVSNWNDLSQVQNNDLCGLADFNEESYHYRNYIKESIKMWLGKGVDALRVDTVKHMPIWFWQEFTTDIMSKYPDIFIFGEWFQGGIYDPVSVNFANRSGMSMLDFSLRQALENVFAKNYYQGFNEIVDVINRDGELLSANELVTFIDNHDMPRFLSVNGDNERMRLALDLIMVARGTPCIYYGSEQYLHNDSNYGNDPYNRPMMDKWDTSTQVYKDISKLSKVRRTNPAVQKGSTLHNFVSTDAYIFERKYVGNICLAAVNKGAKQTVKLNNLSLEDGKYKDVLNNKELIVSNGCAEIVLDQNDFQVYSIINRDICNESDTFVEFHLNGYKTSFGEELYVTGDCAELGNWDVEKAVKLEYVNTNTWTMQVPIIDSKDKFINYKYFVKNNGKLTRENAIGRNRYIINTKKQIWKDLWQS